MLSTVYLRWFPGFFASSIADSILDSLYSGYASEGAAGVPGGCFTEQAGLGLG